MIAEQAVVRRLPTMFQRRENVEAAGLMSYGASLIDQFRQATGCVDRILRGARPADLPVEQPTKFELVIKLKTAKALDLALSPSLIARADEVIESLEHPPFDWNQSNGRSCSNYLETRAN